MSDKAKKDGWEIFQVITNFLGVVVLGGVGLFVSSAIQSRDANAKLVETAVGVLRAKPDESNKGLRVWAMAVVNKYSQVPLSLQAQEELRTNALPAGNYLTDEFGNVLTDEHGNRLITN